MERGRPRTLLRALVTGGPLRTCAVVAALERRGFSVENEHGAGGWGPVPLPCGPFHCYVQLPWTSQPDGGAWLPDGLAARLDLLAAVAPRLSPKVAVLLAFDESDPGRPEVSAELLRALAMVILEESGRPDARVVPLPAAELCGPPEGQRALVEGSILQDLGRARAETVSASR